MIGAVLNHIWQSTLFTFAIAFLAISFRKNRAEVRYWLWFVASCKFFIPFSLLLSLGSHIGSVHAVAKTVMAPAVSFTIEEISRPFPHAVRLTPAATDAATNWLPIVAGALWICGFAAIVVIRFREWLRMRELVRSSSLVRTPAPISVRSTSVLVEPSVVGLLRPILLLPAGITKCLTPCQLKAVLAHELCHVHRRDNIAAAAHMVVEAIFWFNPVVWWIGARLLEERERSCDEEVLRVGNAPQIYAESILKTCQFYVESRLACVSAISGSSLKKRIEAIMAGPVRRELIFGQKLLLAVAAAMTVGGPLVFGALNTFGVQVALQAPRQSSTPLAFEVASIKQNRSLDRRRSSKRLQFTPGGRFVAVNLPLDAIIGIAYSLSPDAGGLSGGPDWIHSARYNIEAVAEKDATPAGSSAKVRDEKMRLMLQTLLADRFKLAVRREVKERPVYALVVAKDGPKLQKANTDENSCVLDSTGSMPCHLIYGGEGHGLHGSAVDMADLARSVSDWTDRPVVDKTGLHGLFNIQTEGWAPLHPRALLPGNGSVAASPASADSSRPTLFMILQRLGLKLESQRAPVESYVIEHVERPTEN
jgi:uncharacterized protein (TIGR03435 family)